MRGIWGWWGHALLTSLMRTYTKQQPLDVSTSLLFSAVGSIILVNMASERVPESSSQVQSTAVRFPCADCTLPAELVTAYTNPTPYTNCKRR